MYSRLATCVVLIAGFASFLVGCGGGTSQSFNNHPPLPNPAPTIDSLSPSCAPRGEQVLNPSANGQLLVNGQNFFASSVVRWNGNDRPTTFYSNSQLTAQISASDIAAAGTAAITVFNSAPGGGTSNSSTFTITTGGVGAHSIAVDQHTGNFAYVANEGCGLSAFGNVSMYTINPTTGALASIGPPVATNDEGASAVTIDPLGKFAYVANWGEGDTAGSVSTYKINATTGALAFTGTIAGECPGLCGPWSVAVDPSGKFAYAAIPSEQPGSAGDVSMYAINASTGGLTSVGTIGAGTGPTCVAFNSTGTVAYVTNSGSNDVSMYTINPTTGILTSIGTITAGSSPASIAIASGNFAYVTNSGSNDVSMYTINATTGTLTSLGTIVAGSGPSSIAIAPSGKFAYVANSGSNSVSMYSIDAATGALTLIGTIGT